MLDVATGMHYISEKGPVHRVSLAIICVGLVYHIIIAGKFGRELNLDVWWSTFATAKLKSANILYLHTSILYVW